MEKTSFYLMTKRIIDFFLATLILALTWPFWLIIGFLIKKDSRGPIFFKQARIGKDHRKFLIYKFRTMVPEAEKQKKKMAELNEADGPVFKIRSDPRLTKIGKKLSYIGIDELPQIINVLKGEMSFVGPRPFPVNEAEELTPWQRQREKVKPGLISSWVVNGTDHNDFCAWMKMDLEDIRRASLANDFLIMIRAVKLFLRLLLNQLVCQE